jgi:hypothetical protein
MLRVATGPRRWSLLLLLAAACHKQPSLGNLEARDAGSQFEHAYNLDGMDDQSFEGGKTPLLDASVNQDHRLYGWAIDGVAQKPASGVVLLIDRKREVAARYGVPRPDVAVALHVPQFANTGFELKIKKGDLPRGTHTVSILILSADGAAFYRTGGEWAVEVR